MQGIICHDGREFGVGLSVFVGEFDFIDSVAEKLYDSVCFPPEVFGGLIFQQRTVSSKVMSVSMSFISAS